MTRDGGSTTGPGSTDGSDRIVDIDVSEEMRNAFLE